MASFGGTALAQPSITFGLATFFQPTGGANGTSVRTKIREALANGIKTTITKSNGYFNNIGEVHVNAATNNTSRKAYPSIDVIWIDERYTNNFQGGNSLGGYNKFARVMIDCHLFDDQCSMDPQDIVLVRETILADMEKYFGTFYYLPDPIEGRAETAFNTIITSNNIFGIEATEPKGGIEITLDISYRILLTDPTQEF